MGLTRMEHIGLSPRKVLSYYKDFECRLPARNRLPYKPLISFAQTEEELNAEVRNMLAYLGMQGYSPRCSFSWLSSGGGQIQLDGSREVKIQVADGLRGNAKAVLAVLAHEVCHKYLHVHGVFYPNMLEVNEVYTDLCTIYVGFGVLILEGYNTVVGNTVNVLGYLTRDVYLSAYGIMCAVNGASMVNIEAANEQFLEEALGVWYDNEDKKSMMMAQFALVEKDEAQFLRNVIYLSEMLRQVEVKAKKRMAAMEDAFFGRKVFDPECQGKVDKPIHLFAAVYETVLADSEQGEDDVFFVLNSILEETMVRVYDAYRDVELEPLPKMYYECPFCGAKSDSDNFAGRSATLKCTKCKKHFRLNREVLDVAKRRECMRRDEQEPVVTKTHVDELPQRVERVKQKMPWWLRYLSKKYLEELMN